MEDERYTLTVESEILLVLQKILWELKDIHTELKVANAHRN